MDVSAIPSVSTAMSQIKLEYAASLKLMKESMTIAEDSMGALLEGMDAMVSGLGRAVDIMG